MENHMKGSGRSFKEFLIFKDQPYIKYESQGEEYSSHVFALGCFFCLKVTVHEYTADSSYRTQ